MRPVFQAHGEFSLYRDGNILVTSVRGPWNIELIKSWAKATLPYTLEMQTIGVWAAVAIVTESMLCPPDALEALRKSVAYSVHHLGCISHSIVAKPDVAGRGFVEPVFRRVYEGLCASNFFDDYESAKVWSNAQIQNAVNSRVGKAN
ncbi:MAG: hypothetical protein V4447_10190 [Pseudomonadota bacterium]